MPLTETIHDAHFYAELWSGLASLLRSYTAAHGIHTNRQAIVEHAGETITVHHANKWLRLERSHAVVTWMRENGSGGRFELTGRSRLRSIDGEETELDLAAESWARDLMQVHSTELAR